MLKYSIIVLGKIRKKYKWEDIHIPADVQRVNANL